MHIKLFHTIVLFLLFSYTDNFDTLRQQTCHVNKIMVRWKQYNKKANMEDARASQMTSMRMNQQVYIQCSVLHTDSWESCSNWGLISACFLPVIFSNRFANMGRPFPQQYTTIGTRFRDAIPKKEKKLNTAP